MVFGVDVLAGGGTAWGLAIGLSIGFPFRPDNWRQDAAPAQTAFARVAAAISQFEPVNVCVPRQHRAAAHKALAGVQPGQHAIKVVELDCDDCWLRDTGPTFVFASERDTEKPKVAGVDWTFNAWGAKYPSFEKDAQVTAKILDACGLPRFEADLVLEGGSIHVDGEGTVLTTEECLLNPNRNPGLSRQEIEQRLLWHLGAEKVVWLPRGLAADHDTDGHIDNMACFVQPGQVLLAWTDDKQDEQYERSREALAVLQSQRDARQRPFSVVKMPTPSPMYYTAEDCDGLKHMDGISRQPGERLAASYVNFYLANGGIVCPSFGCTTDDEAVAVLRGAFPRHRVVQVPGREILLGGGNIHCVTQQQPALL